MRGQLDISFQWIYVVLAGGAFLLIFFFAFRACTQGEEQQAAALGLRSAATMLSTGAWQPESVRNVTINAEVACIAGTMTLTSNAASAQVQRAAIFAPPMLSGKVSFVAEEIELSASGVPGISYGNVLYVFDENTHYYSIGDVGFTTTSVTAAGFKTVDVPDAAKTVIIATRDNIDFASLELPETDARIYGVVVRNGEADFYAQDPQNPTRLRKTGSSYAGVLAKGAMVSGSSGNFGCAKAAFAQRARDISGVYVQRSIMLKDAMQQSCQDQHAIALSVMNRRMSDDDLLRAITDERLVTAQRSLYSMGCPVIA